MPNFITQFLALLLFQNYLNTLASASTNDSLSYSNLQKDCQDLFFNVTIETTTNKNISLSNVSLQPQLNQFIQDAISTNVIESAIVGSFNVSGTFTIGATLCDPKGQKPTTIEHLTHGIPHDRTYWDLLIGNLSWVDVALAYGYSTLAIDRLGVGQSEMPDGLNIVQTGVNIEIANSINNMLRAGQIGNREFSKIINVGHSYGSYITNGLGVFHPSSADAFVLTGFGHAKGNTPALLMAWDSVPAHLSQTNPALRSAPSSHYAAPMGLNSLTQSYFHYPQ
ncbi:hypothetical protein G7Y89_g11209 [Cudoniella acicularis]|uniref:AB hydrolase-1 domain-containing protein n=1 Tax=Cudoniella acicularis TaxID=354080 RepID=A0A8H4REX1_9HELO|nr:hypothetical protein G7Y89_g11209 [Cudoniella acicularis]